MLTFAPSLPPHYFCITPHSTFDQLSRFLYEWNHANPSSFKQTKERSLWGASATEGLSPNGKRIVSNPPQTLNRVFKPSNLYVRNAKITFQANLFFFVFLLHSDGLYTTNFQDKLWIHLQFYSLKAFSSILKFMK